MKASINKITFLAFLCISVFIYCCTPKAAPKTAPAPEFSDADVARGKVFWSDCSVEKLSAAKNLYTGKCGTCHALKALSSEDEAGWKKIVPPMAKKANLNAEEQALILNYVLTMKDSKK